jgi:hypothetical protein
VTLPYRVLSLMIVCLAITACSSSSGNDSKDDNAKADVAKASFASAINGETRQWGKVAATMFIGTVTTPLSDASAIAGYNKSNVVPKLCDHLKRFEEQTRDSENAFSLQTEALEFADKSAVDSAVFALFEHALAAQPPERDRLLNLLIVGVNHANDPAFQVNGVQALQEAQLLDPAGKLVIPPTEYLKGGDPEGPYWRYRNWFTKHPGLVLAAATLASGVNDGLRDCAGRKN